ncbi:MAG TPA: penicillin-binding protein 2 [Alphaproteobacteria bacterium]|nr:penicillin-binding protein 2 [Alphaproteobacteria bacterium]USO04819.1 MAG: penicillin-binding protein 2 [Rhodospirillales bacterium]HOO80883.1 penicillin-binding protein 2 [Alphaproteobacteria bacterium]
MIFSQRLRRNTVKIEGERSSALDLARGRLVLMSGFFILVYMVFAVRAFDLAIIQGHAIAPDNGQIAESNMLNINGETPRRADITDRNGALLATTLKTASLYADPRLIADADAAAKKLIIIFPDLKYGDILQKLQSQKRFVWLQRNVSPDQQYQVLQIGEPGLEFEEGYKRFYPQGALAAHLLGYGNVDAQGLAGIERSFNKHLGGGHDLKLTLDIRLQHVLRREMLKAVEEFEAIGAAGAIMDVTTGEILAGVSLPDFNPHDPGRADKDAIFNRLTLGAYELGSVFKIFSTAAFFEAHDVPMSTTFDASEPIKIGRHTIHDYHAEDRVLTIPEVFMYSSNIGSALMGRAVGTDALRSFYRDLGLLDPLDFEVREVTRPLVPHPWREVNTLTASYGHGVSTTPLQLITAVSSIVNGGYLVKPSLVLDEQSDEEEPGKDIRIVSAETAQRMRQLLRLVVTDGTAKKAEVKGYRVGGKTGTAEKIADGRYDSKKKISSFVGIFPMDEPRYAVFIMVDEPKGQKHTWNYATGGWVAAPAVARVIASMAAILGISPAGDNTPENHFGESLKQFVSTKEEH